MIHYSIGGASPRQAKTHSLANMSGRTFKIVAFGGDYAGPEVTPGPYVLTAVVPIGADIRICRLWRKA